MVSSKQEVVYEKLPEGFEIINDEGLTSLPEGFEIQDEGLTSLPEGFEIQKPSLKDFIFNPLSKTLTGKSINERLNLIEKQQKSLDEFAYKRAMEGKPASVFELFVRGLPAYTAKTILDLVDISPSDIALTGILAGLSKIPIKGIPIGEIASKIPINKRFFKSFDEFVRYQNWLKTYTPLSSRGITQTTKVISTPKATTPKFAENINLEKYPEDVRQYIFDLVSKEPSIGKTPKISDKELLKMASELKDTPTIKFLASLPEGSIEAEALKVRMGNVEAIRNALAGELGELKNKLDEIIKEGLTLHRKTASIFGRGLRQQRIPAETQQKMASLIDDTLSRIKKDPIFSKDKELINTIVKLKETVLDKEFNPTLWDKVYFAWLNSILSNPFTHLVNVSSNTLFTLSKIPEKILSATMDLPLSMVTGKRTHYFKEVPAMIAGMFKKTPIEIQTGTKLDYPVAPIKGMAGKIIGLPTRLLQKEDDLIKPLIGRMEYYAQKVAGKTGDELLQAVQKEQLYRTFQDDVGIIANALMSLREKIPGLRFVIPFIKTPANIIARSLERTPLVAGKIIRKGLAKQYTQEELAKDLGNLALGTLLTAWVGYKWAKGEITGRAPKDPAKRDAFYRQGKKPNAIKIGDYWVPIDRLEPLGTSISVIVNLFEDYKKSEKESIPEKALDSIGQLGSTLLTKTYFSGITNLIQALADPEMYGAGYMRKIASGAVPQLLKFFADLKDPYYREANSVLDELKRKTPFLSETLPPKLNVFGEPIKRDLFNIGKANESLLEKAIAETPISFPSKTLEGEKLTPEEYRFIVYHSGQAIKKVLENLNYDEFMKLPVEIRERILNTIVSQIRQVPRGLIRIKKMKEKLISK